VIATLRGKILTKGINSIVLDVNGVGYGVALSLSSLGSLPQNGDDAFLHIHTALRENSLELYGFVTAEEKSLFEMLLTVSGIGPRTSLVILSGISPEGFVQAVLSDDVNGLTAVPGIGKKSAERIIVELREKVRRLSRDRGREVSATSAAAGMEDDLVSSLSNLGYKERVAEAAARKILKQADRELSLPEAVKLALKELMK
jgi:holliday junction DNA helicase RuvA